MNEMLYVNVFLTILAVILWATVREGIKRAKTIDDYKTYSWLGKISWTLITVVMVMWFALAMTL